MNTILVLGTFDGVHIGHQALVRFARERGEHVVACTFDRPPAAFFTGQNILLTEEEEKTALLKQCGSDEVFVQPFDEKTAQTEAADYIAVLSRRFHPHAVAVGFDHRFGKRASGGVKELIEAGKRYDFSVFTMPPVIENGEPVSSTRIRASLAQGDVERANSLLGRRYALTGRTAHGYRVGTRMDFPTANLTPAPGRLLPQTGVYATLCKVGGRTYKGMTNVGVNPTFGRDRVTVETHLIGFSGDIYDQTLSVAFVKKVREERAFPSADALSEQLRRDALLINAYLDTVLDLPTV